MNWIEITDTIEASRIYNQLVEMLPCAQFSSLHAWENRYVLDGKTYRLFIIMSQPDYWTLEVLE